MSIILYEISKGYAGRTLFEDVTVNFNPRKRYALTGPNGSGKSTLLKIIMGDVEPTTGTVNLPEKVGMLRQNIEDYRDQTVRDVVIMGNQRLWKALEEREKLYEGEMTDAVGMRLGELEEVVADEDGYSADSAAEELLTGMGITTFDKKMHEVPAGWQFRALLAQALFGNPQALLLDEPTNHLDLSSIGWLERFLHDYTGTLIVVSHDRHFLNAVATDIADIDYETVITYPGNYDDMLITKSSVRKRSEEEAKGKEKKIAKLKDFVARFGAGTRASQAQSRIREIDRLQPDELKKSNIVRPYVRFERPERASGKIVCALKGVSKGYGEEAVISNFSYEIHRGDKIAIIGNNGRGKTTLLKLIAQLTTPDQGTIEYGHQVETSYFPQNHSEVLSRQTEDTAFDWLRSRKAGLYDQEIRSVLGKMLFGGDDAFKQTASLSGGEAARLILGGMMLEEHNFIILDEPNNHLDLEAVSALSWGLEEYKGTAIVATHDRGLANQFATKIIALEEDGIHTFDGSLEDYLASKA